MNESKEGAPVSATAPAEDTKPCPVCAETIKAAAIKCRFCGEDLQAFAAKREAEQERDIFEGRPATLYTIWHYLLSVLTLGIAYIVYWIVSATIHYRITTQRVVIERGIFNKTRKNVELFRVDDIDIEQPLTMRMVGHGRLRLKTSDRDQPIVELYGIRGLIEVGERLREQSIKERERRGVKVWADA